MNVNFNVNFCPTTVPMNSETHSRSSMSFHQIYNRISRFISQSQIDANITVNIFLQFQNHVASDKSQNDHQKNSHAEIKNKSQGLIQALNRKEAGANGKHQLQCKVLKKNLCTDELQLLCTYLC